jgi:spore coat polysaccharide biosynthesis protein SpsF
MVAAIIQARMGSTRLPGKVLRKVDGLPLLKYQIDRARRSGTLDKIIVATTDSREDEPIVLFCKNNNIDCFRGSEDDVLSRYYECARHFKADTIVRLTADCPLSDPEIIDEVIELYRGSGADYAANTVPPETRKYPSGLDVEVFSFPALERAHQEAGDKHDREHVTFYFWKYDNGFKTAQLESAKDRSKYRFSVDYPEDLEVIEFIVGTLKDRNSFGHAEELFDIMDKNPDIKKKNSQYYFGIGWEK